MPKIYYGHIILFIGQFIILFKNCNILVVRSGTGSIVIKAVLDVETKTCHPVSRTDSDPIYVVPSSSIFLLTLNSTMTGRCHQTLVHHYYKKLMFLISSTQNRALFYRVDHHSVDVHILMR